MFTSKVIQKQKLNKKIVYLKLQLVSPTNIDFTTGQFISMKVSEDTYRPYSIASSSTDNNTLDFFISANHQGVGANYINSLNLNEIVEFNGPFGRFTLTQPLNSSYVFIATGAGIAPILPMIQDILANKNKSNIKLLFGLRDSSEIFALDKIEQFKKDNNNFDYLICFSKDNPDSNNKNYYSNRVTDALLDTKLNLNSYINNNSQFYICGNPQMVVDCYNILLEKNIDKQNLHFERFTIQKKDS